jgi:phage-related protein
VAVIRNHGSDFAEAAAGGFKKMMIEKAIEKDAVLGAKIANIGQQFSGALAQVQQGAAEMRQVAKAPEADKGASIA